MKHSAGVLIYRRPSGTPEVLLVKPGGPYWRHKDLGAWQIPKGGIDHGETTEAAARREAQEELGAALQGPLQPLGDIRQAGGKLVTAFAIEQDLDAERIVSNTFAMEWPPRSGRMEEFPEVDAARWLSIDAARAAILPSQEPLLDRLLALLG